LREYENLPWVRFTFWFNVGMVGFVLVAAILVAYSALDLVFVQGFIQRGEILGLSGALFLFILGFFACNHSPFRTAQI